MVAGVDLGSTTAKTVLLEEGRIVGTSLAPVGVEIVKDAARSLESALQQAGIGRSDVGFVAGTGYGRFKVHFGQRVVTEISCHARGAHHLFPGTRLVVDIGGQDTKAIRVDERGSVVEFAMNDKCAAGTGRFLEVCANALGYDIGEMGSVALEATQPTRISSTCTVFAESEVVSHRARGRRVPDILAGVHQSIATRTLSLVQRVGVHPEVTFTGGVSRNQGMVRALSNAFGLPVNVDPLSQYVGALGAAMFAQDTVNGAAP